MSDIESKTYYELLGVEPEASTEQIREAYREIARIYHPDSNFYSDIIADGVTPDESDVFKQITAAYNVLVDHEKRREYDDTIITNLDSWGEDDNSWDNSAAQAHATAHAEEDELKGRSKTQEIPEEWLKEREYFEQHYAEILKPAPKVNLVGKEEDKPFTDWEEEINTGTRFGTVVTDSELESIPAMPQMRRPATRRANPINFKDPFMWMLISIPVLVFMVLIEVFVFL